MEDCKAVFNNEKNAIYRRAIGKVMYAALVRSHLLFTVKEMGSRLMASIGAGRLRLKLQLKY